MIPKEYRWMKPGVPCKTDCGYDFIRDKPRHHTGRLWVVDLRFGKPLFCCFVDPSDLNAIPTEQESREFQARINRGLKEMRGV